MAEPNQQQNSGSGQNPPAPKPNENEPKPSEQKKKEAYHYPTKLDPQRKLVSTSGYLDDEMRREAEINRARVEGREPDLKNPPAMQSTPLVREDRLRRTNVIPDGKKPDVTL